jgi:hypothetical protein
VITSVVIMVAGYGLIAALNGEKVAQAMSARRSEMNRAFDFMTNEIRMAQAINRTANGTYTSLATAATQPGLPLGSYGTLALYLEIPTTSAPAVCPNGSPPPLPSDYDRIVYDIRPSPSGWLGPRTIHRYGRTPRADGTINPCNPPISSDVLVDAIADNQDTPPVCNTPGILTGADGFMACVNGAQVDLFLQSAVAGKSARKIQSAASSRLMSITQSINIQLRRSTTTTPKVNNWDWDTYSGTQPSLVYELSRQINGGSPSIIYTGSNTSFSEDWSSLTINSGDKISYWVEAKLGTQSLDKSALVVVTNP